MSTPTPALLREKQAAAYLAIAPSTLAKMRAKGYQGAQPPVPFRKFGKAVLYSIADLDAYIAALPRGA
jgi:hypothetical protein